MDLEAVSYKPLLTLLSLPQQTSELNFLIHRAGKDAD